MKRALTIHLMFILTLLPSRYIVADTYVTLAPISDVRDTIDFEFPASAVPINTTLLSAGISAEIIAIHSRPGDRISKGLSVIDLDCRDIVLMRDLAEQDVEQAEVQLAFRDRQAERISKLAETNIASEEMKDTRATELQRAHINLLIKQIVLEDSNLQESKCQLKAPFNAVVINQLASVGTRAAVGTPILEVVSEAVDVHVRVPFDFEVSEGQSAVFDSNFGEVAVTLAVESQAVDTVTGTRLIRFIPEVPIKPGTPGEIRVRSDAAVLPADYLVNRNGLYGIMVASDGRAQFIPRPDATIGQPVLVSDLPESVLLIIDGRFKARDGDTLVLGK